MILNIESLDGETFILPNIQLDDSRQWTMKIVNFCALFKVPLSKNTLLLLSTNIISRSAGNPKQILIAFALSAGSTIINISPTQETQYKIRFHDLKTSKFHLYDLDARKLEIFKAHVQLEICESFDGF